MDYGVMLKYFIFEGVGTTEKLYCELEFCKGHVIGKHNVCI